MMDYFKWFFDFLIFVGVVMFVGFYLECGKMVARWSWGDWKEKK